MSLQLAILCFGLLMLLQLAVCCFVLLRLYLVCVVHVDVAAVGYTLFWAVDVAAAVVTGCTLLL